MMVSGEVDPGQGGTIWALNLDEPAPVITPLVAATFRQVGRESALAVGTSLGGDTSEEVLQRFETGRRCYTAWVEGTLAAYGWVSINEEFVGELNLRLWLLPGEAYLWDCATVPIFRRQSLYSALLAYILGELRGEKLCRAWIGADMDNMPSQRGIARAGFRRVADLVVEQVLPLRMAWVQGRPGVPESLVSEARRVFLGDRDKVWLEALSSATSQPHL
jgi:ribosomal protein S18 acetylase RimI-like enzyme